MNTVNSGKKYIPAASHDWLLPFYDPFVKLLGAEAARKTLLDQAAIEPGFRSSTSAAAPGALLS
jgi:hypothetical protein